MFNLTLYVIQLCWKEHVRSNNGELANCQPAVKGLVIYVGSDTV